MSLARLMPKEEIQQIGVCCRICNYIWYGEPTEEDY